MPIEIPFKSPTVVSAFARGGFLTDVLLTDKWQKAPEEEIIKRVSTILSPQSVGSKDPLLYFLGAYPLFQFTVSHPHAYRVLAEDLATPDGYWRNTIEQITIKDQYDLTDIIFLHHAGVTVAELIELADKGELKEDTSWAKDYLQNHDEVLSAASNLILISTQGNSSFAEHYLRLIQEFLPKSIEKARLQPGVSSEITRVFAGHILHNFTMVSSAAKGDESMFYIYHNRGRYRDNGIEVQRNLPAWAQALNWVLLVFADKERNAVVEQISDKIVKDVARELADIQRIHKDGWDDEFIARVIGFLQRTGFTIEQRKTIYDRLPDFLSLPADTQCRMFSSRNFVSLIQEEISQIKRLKD